MPLIVGQVGAPPVTSFPDGSQPNALMGKSAEIIFSELHGKYYTQTVRGNVFHGSTPIAGVAIPISSSTSPTPVLWNPSGSGVNVILLNYTAAYTGGTGVVGAFAYYVVTGAGNTIATGAPFSAFAATTPTNGLVGAGNTSKVKFSATGTCTLTTAGVLLKPFGVGQSAVASAGTSIWGPFREDFDGSIVIPPGVAIYPAATAASVDTFAQSLSWEEAPI